MPESSRDKTLEVMIAALDEQFGDCPLTGGQCWHDGTSMYARETVWPRAEIYLRNGDHDGIFRMLEREYELHFERVDDADAA